MINNHLKVASRTLKTSKVFTIINVLGLAIGISAFVLMTTFVFEELSYDQFHDKKDRIFRLSYRYTARGTQTHVSRVAFPLKELLLDQYGEVERVVRFYQNRMDISTLRNGESVYTEEDIFFVDPEVFEVFSFELERGDPKTALSEARSIVLTRKAAKKYFGEEDPMGKTLEFKEGEPLEVTGILKEVPSNSHIPFDVLLPLELQRTRWMRGAGNNGYDFEKDWRWSGAWMYVLLKEADQLPGFREKILNAGRDLFGQLPGGEVTYEYMLHNLTDLYFQSSVVSQIGVNGNINQVYTFSVVAFLILVIACVNFINLSTARATRRAKEVGLRKVLGALKPQLIGQFITESVLICAMATVLGLLLVEVILPFFNHFTEKNISVPYFSQPIILLYLLFGVIVLGTIAGLYPAFYLSAFRPIKTLKGNFEDPKKGHMGLRRLLVVLQFMVCNLLIIGILVLHRQMVFVKNKDVGFDQEQILVLVHGSKIDDDFRLFADRVKGLPGVANVNQGYVAGEKGWVQSFRVNGQETHEGKSMGHKMISYDFMDMYDLELIAGRNFLRSVKTDSVGAAMLNESALRAFGWSPEEALGKKFSYIGGSDNQTRFELKVIGVFKDANFESLYEPVRPSVFQLAYWGDVAIKFNVDDREALFSSLGDVEKVWQDMASEWPFEYRFLDQKIEEQYRKDELLGDMITYFGILAIFIAGLGLFGLASFSVQRRTKEIGVRKVMGATVRSILLLVTKGFAILVILSFLISVPLGYYLSNQWLEDFAFRISLSADTFLLAGIISLAIGFCAVFYQVLRAAVMDPVNSLRYE